MTDKPSNFDIIAELIKETSGQGNIISLPRIYLKIAGDVVVGLFLSQCVWYSDKGGSHDGWFYKSNKEWQEEIGLSYAQIKRATAKLEEMGILHTKLKKAKGAPTTHYYMDMNRLTRLIFDFLEIRQNGGVENQQSLKSKDFQESEKTLTALTPASTGTTLTERGAAEKTPSAPSLREQAQAGQMTTETELDLLCGFGRQGQAGVSDPSQDIETYMRYTNDFLEMYRKRTSLHADSNVQKPAIQEIATQPGADLDLWDKVITAWVKHGWNKRNVAGMLECYERGEIPSTGNRGKPNGPNKRPNPQRDPDETFLDPERGLVRRDPSTGKLVPVS